MSASQPEALRLAALLDSFTVGRPQAITLRETAAELRRIHAECEALRADAVTVIDGHKIKVADVLRRTIRNLKPKRGKPMWHAVHEATAHGSTVSMGLCRWAGVDPDTGAPLDGERHG